MTNTPSQVATDTYGRTVMGATDGVTDTYSVDGAEGYTLAFPHGTPLAKVLDAFSVGAPTVDETP